MEIDHRLLEKYVSDGIEARRSIDVGSVVEVSKILHDRLTYGGKLITFGNGGSAADAQHFAAELSGRFMMHWSASFLTFPPSLPVNTRVNAPIFLAVLMPSMTLGELPEVLIPTTKSSLTQIPSICLENTCVKS